MRCFNFLLKLLKKLKLKLPSNLTIFSKINTLAMTKIFKPTELTRPDIMELGLEYFRNDSEN